MGQNVELHGMADREWHEGKCAGVVAGRRVPIAAALGVRAAGRRHLHAALVQDNVMA